MKCYSLWQLTLKSIILFSPTTFFSIDLYEKYYLILYERIICHIQIHSYKTGIWCKKKKIYRMSAVLNASFISAIKTT